MEKPSHFPLFIDLRGRRCVIVGGGAVGSRRAEVLLGFGAEVTVISPQWSRQLPGVRWLKRTYRPGDLAGAALAVAATNQRETNRSVGEEARRLGVPVSVSDRREESTFYFPAICQAGGVTAGLVSLGGTDHHRTARAAKRVRRVLEELE